MAEFTNRRDAGRRLAGFLVPFASTDAVVLGLPRGGVIVAAEVARALTLPLDVIIVRKVGVPFHEEVAMGAVGEGGVLVRNEDVLGKIRVSAAEFDAAVAREQRDVAARVLRWRGEGVRLDLTGRTAILVDDGIATGATVRAATQVVRRLGAARVVVATPVAPPELGPTDLGADDLVVAYAPRGFRAVGLHYDDFEQTSDTEVASVLAHRT